MTDGLETMIGELRATLGKMEIALGSIDEAIVWTDGAGDIQWCNSVFDSLVGRSHITVLGRPATELLVLNQQGRPLPRAAHPVGVVLRTGNDTLDYYEMPGPNGTRIVEVAGRHLTLGPGKPFALLTVRDVTAGREMESIRLQSAALAAAANAIVITNREGLVTWTNPAFTELTGFDLDRIYGRSLKMLASGQTPAETYAGMWRIILSGEVWSGRMVNRRRDGSTYLEEQTITPVADEAGRVSHFISIKQDITEQDRLDRELADRVIQMKAAQKALSDREARLRAILTSATDAIIIVDETGVIEQVNPAVEEVFDWPPGSLVGQAVTVLMPERYHQAHRDGMSRFLTTGASSIIGSRREVTGVRRDGGEVPLELAVNKVDLKDRVLFTGILRDISARQAGEEALRRASEEILAGSQRLAVTLASMEEGVLATDSRGRIVLVNAAAGRMLGLSQEQMTDRPLFEVVHLISEASGAMVADPVDAVLSTGRAETLPDYASLLVGGEEQVPVSGSAAPMRDQTGRLIGVVVLLHDVSRERELDRLKLSFVSSVSHEMRTPLTSIKGFTDTIIQDREMDPAVRLEFLDIIAQESDRLSTLVADVLDFSRIESGRFELNIAEVNATALMDKVVANLEPLALDKGLVLAASTPGHPVLMKGDGPKLQSVISNLVDNAIKFTPDGGRVDLELESSGTRVVITVADTGPGLPPGAEERIFESFYRAEHPAGHIKGTGLGLAITRRIVELHSGRVLASNRPGGGARFEVALPLTGPPV